MHCYGNAADFWRNPQMADSSKTQLHSHSNALAESSNWQPAYFGVTVALQVKVPNSKCTSLKRKKFRPEVSVEQDIL